MFSMAQISLYIYRQYLREIDIRIHVCTDHEGGVDVGVLLKDTRMLLAA